MHVDVQNGVTGLTLLIRPAAFADLAALHSLIERTYRGDSARRGWTHEADLLGGQRTDRETLEQLLSVPGSAVLLADGGGKLAGCVHVQRVANGAYLGLLSVDPDRQAGGLGRSLVTAAELYAARSLGAKRMEMTVIRQRGELIAWYERLGYSQTGELRPFPLDDPRFGLPKMRDLEFVVLAKAL